jgi:hypothetical protein
VYHPGEVLTVHWIRQTAASVSGPAGAAPLTLTAQLDGEFAGAAEAKAPNAVATEHVRAAPVRVIDRATTTPVSRLRIPVNAAPGLYNLTTTVSFGGGSTASGTSTIRVAKH